MAGKVVVKNYWVKVCAQNAGSQERCENMAKKRKQTVATYIKNTADVVFSKYIRLKYANRTGYAKCVTCCAVKHISELDAGHYESRRHGATRFDEKNVHPQCQHCNRFCEGDKPKYALYLIETYGAFILPILRGRAAAIKKWTLAELKEMVAEWRAEIEKMLTVKHG